MKEYILLFHGAVHDEKKIPAEVLRGKSSAWGEWIAYLQENGVFVGGTGFEERVCRHRAAEDEISWEEIDPTDGLVGYIRLKAADLDQLRALCRRYPDWDLHGWIEIREVSGPGE